MGLGGLYDNVSRGLSSAKNFLGRAYHGGVKFAQGLDQYVGVAPNVIGAVAPMVGSMGGPMGVPRAQQNSNLCPGPRTLNHQNAAQGHQKT